MESSRFLEADPIDHELSQTSLCTVVFKKLASWGLCVSFFYRVADCSVSHVILREKITVWRIFACCKKSSVFNQY